MNDLNLKVYESLHFQSQHHQLIQVFIKIKLIVYNLMVNLIPFV